MPKKINDYFAAVGRRKSAVARVRLSKGQGEFSLNGKVSETPDSSKLVLNLVGREGEFDISTKVTGGGMTSQLDAIKLGIARALVAINPDFRKTLRKAGLLTRDARVKERKKPGLKRARRAPQWSKR